MKNKKYFLAVLFLGISLVIPSITYAQEESAVVEEEPVEETQLVIEESPEIALPEEEEVLEEDPLPELIAEEEVSDESLSFGGTIPSLTIQVEQIAWNQFRFRPSTRIGVTDAEYIWQLGDETRETSRIVDHTFSAPGTYQVELGVIDTNGTPQMATVQVHVGFFHLANWRLWIIMALLALIIVLAAIIAGVTDSLVPKVGKSTIPPKKMQPMPASAQPLADLAEDTDSLDTLATTGTTGEDLSDELALLESLDNTGGDSSESDELLEDDPLAALDGLEDAVEMPMEESAEEIKVQPLAASVEAKPKKVAKKKATKKKSSKAKTAVKKKSTTKKKAKPKAKKKKTATKKKKK